MINFVILKIDPMNSNNTICEIIWLFLIATAYLLLTKSELRNQSKNGYPIIRETNKIAIDFTINGELSNYRKLLKIICRSMSKN